MIELTTPLLAIDVGRGTQDILVYEPGRALENSIKLVLPSPTVVVAERIRQATRAGLPIFLDGFLMGAGRIPARYGNTWQGVSRSTPRPRPPRPSMTTPSASVQWASRSGPILQRTR